MVKRKHIFESIVIVETVIIIIVAIFMFAGYPISLMLNGFAPQNSEILYAGIDDNENEYRVVELRDGGKIKEVAIFTKTFLPIWKKNTVISWCRYI